MLSTIRSIASYLPDHQEQEATVVFICGINAKDKPGATGRTPKRGECKARFQTLQELLEHVRAAHPKCGSKLLQKPEPEVRKLVRLDKALLRAWQSN